MIILQNILNYRYDLVFSYWIFLWYLLYIFRIINISPKLALCLSIIENTILFLIMFFILKCSNETIIKFLIINTFIKVIPLYSIWNDKINWLKDIYYIFILFIIYIIWCYIFGNKIFDNQINLVKSNNYKKDNLKKFILYIMTPATPGTLLYDDLKKYLDN